MPDTMRFEDLKKLTDREVQTLLREVDQKDFAVAFKDVSSAVKDKFLGNMSERVRIFITEEMEYLGPMNAGEVLEAQGRVLKQALQLVEQGQVSWPKDKTKGGRKPRKQKPDKAYAAAKQQLLESVARPLEAMCFAEIDEIFASMAEIARRDGILALEEFAEAMVDPYLKMAFRLAVDGTEPALIMDILQTWRDSRVHEYVVRNNKVMEGILAIQAGDNPRIVEVKTSRIY